MKLCKSSRSESFTSDLGEFCEARVTGCRPLALDGARASIPRSGLDLDSSIPRFLVKVCQPKVDLVDFSIFIQVQLRGVEIVGEK